MNALSDEALILRLTEIGQAAQQGPPDETIAALEEMAGLSRDIYGDLDSLRGRLGPWLRQRQEPLPAMYVQMLTDAMGMARRYVDALSVVTCYLDLDPQALDLTPGLFAERLSERLGDNSQDDLRASLVLTLHGLLGVIGRDSEGFALIAHDLGLRWPPSGDPLARRREFAERLRARVGSLQPDAAAYYLCLIVPSLVGLGLDEGAVHELERFLDIEASDYGAGGKLAAKLSTWLGSVQNRLNGQMCFIALAMGLDPVAPDRGVAILEWCVGIDPIDYGDRERLSRKWTTYRDVTYPDVAATCWRVLTGMLESLGPPRWPDLIALVEVDSGLKAEDYGSPESLNEKLSTRLAGLQVDTSAAYIVSLVMTFRKLGELEKAYGLVNWFRLSYRNFWEIPDGGDAGSTHVIPLMGYWLEYFGRSDRQIGLAVCRQSVVYLRRSLNDPGVTIPDREQFISYVDTLRRHILETGYYWVGLPGDDAAPEVDPLLELQLWDAELGQRVLFERLLLTEVGEVTPAEPPVDDWPFTGPRPTSPSHLPDREAWDIYSSLLQVGEDGGEAAEVAAVSVTIRRSLRPDDLLYRAEQIVREGLDGAKVAEAIGPGAVLLRARFLADESLAWVAIAGNGRDLRVMASGRGEPLDRWRIDWAGLRHDLGLELIKSPPAAQEWENFRAKLDRLGRALSPEHAGDSRAEVVESLDQLGGLHIVEASGMFAKLSELLRPPLDKTDDWGAWAAAAKSELDRLGDLARLCSEVGTSSSGDRIGMADEITRRFLKEVARVWDVSPLEAALTGSDHLVFQVDDVLQAVPLAHLPTPEGTPLYRMVRSVRTSLSVLVSLVQQQLERSVGPCPSPGRTLTVSSFPEDRCDAQDHVIWLHHGQRWLAECRGYVALNAAERPPGVLGAMRAALDPPREGPRPKFGVATLCGHGNGQARSMEIEGGLWKGDGCDWTNVDLLILLSCSVGRLSQIGDLDAEGLCVQLALRRARCVLACRWPVLVLPAVAFANEVTSQYTEPETADANPNAETRRAEAVQRARLRFLGPDDRPLDIMSVGLNTVAAFELYGMG